MELLSQALLLLLYLRVSDVYISNQPIFRSFHCTSLSLLSLKNTLRYGLSNMLEMKHPIQTMLLDVSFSLDKKNKENNYQNNEDFFLKIIPFYFLTYLLYDLKHCYKRYDLFIHHVTCFIWCTLNYKNFLGFISFIIMAEGVTFAYFITSIKYQCIYRLLFTTFVRFPIWLINIIKIIKFYNEIYIKEINACIFTVMFFMDCIWFNQTLKKVKQHL
jgi:hypothetical protein